MTSSLCLNSLLVLDMLGLFVPLAFTGYLLVDITLAHCFLFVLTKLLLL